MKSQRKEHYGEEDLLLHYYGELDEEQRGRLEEHLTSCSICRDAWLALQRTLGAVPRVSLAVSTEDSRRFAARVARQAGRRRLSRGWLWGGTLATAALLALTLSIRPSGLLPDRGPKVAAEAAIVQDLELLQNMELLEQLELLQELDRQG
jgi:anti-sigma factor RsiW